MVGDGRNFLRSGLVSQIHGGLVCTGDCGLVVFFRTKTCAVEVSGDYFGPGVFIPDRLFGDDQNSLWDISPFGLCPHNVAELVVVQNVRFVFVSGRRPFNAIGFLGWA